MPNKNTGGKVFHLPETPWGGGEKKRRENRLKNNPKRPSIKKLGKKKTRRKALRQDIGGGGQAPREGVFKGGAQETQEDTYRETRRL